MVSCHFLQVGWRHHQLFSLGGLLEIGYEVTSVGKFSLTFITDKSDPARHYWSSTMYISFEFASEKKQILL